MSETIGGMTQAAPIVEAMALSGDVPCHATPLP